MRPPETANSRLLPCVGVNGGPAFKHRVVAQVCQARQTVTDARLMPAELEIAPAAPADSVRRHSCKGSRNTRARPPNQTWMSPEFLLSHPILCDSDAKSDSPKNSNKKSGTIQPISSPRFIAFC